MISQMVIHQYMHYYIRDKFVIDRLKTHFYFICTSEKTLKNLKIISYVCKKLKIISLFSIKLNTYKLNTVLNLWNWTVYDEFHQKSPSLDHILQSFRSTIIASLIKKLVFPSLLCTSYPVNSMRGRLIGGL